MASWIHHRQARPEAAARLFCLPHAGGGASAFAGWGALAPAEVEVCPIQLPGRENRLSEPAFTDMAALAAGLADALMPMLDLPFALFGHSMGARVAYALASELADRGLSLPSALIVSASRSPHHPSVGPRMHDLADERFADELAALGGLPDAIRRSGEMMEIAVSVARADFTVLETWHPPLREPLAAFILALGGEDDRLAPRPALESWSGLADGGFRLRLFSGGHFYLKEHANAVVAEACSALFRGLDRRLPSAARLPA